MITRGFIYHFFNDLSSFNIGKRYIQHRIPLYGDKVQ